MNRTTRLLSISALAASIAACGGGSDGSVSSSTGQVSFDVTDAPAMEFADVTVSFTGIRLKPEDGDWVEFTFDEPKAWNLLELQGGVSEPLITDEEVPAGQYSELRLMINTENLASYVTLASTPDEKSSLAVPSGEQSGLKLKGGFVVAADTTTDFTIDFDVSKSIVDPQGGSIGDYLLKPSLRLVNNLEVGSITGQVNYALISSTRLDDVAKAECEYEGAAYIFAGADVTPTDLNVNNEENPLLVIPVTYDEETSLYSYTAAFLPEGPYTVAYSCQLDDNEADDELEFDGIQTVDVIVGTPVEAQDIPLVE
ncbi:DUF4382 domain-containing protein [Marinobacter salinexigens]|uniref:DUF4382 domain-containing protein n=1 Tax=Marinobacter salinexigens TaxID=2919747 RepID=A0A5B0V7Q9_9GAMM|nr:DUF4382 domain-containing protein [Marinobacter salinexigens]KAA1170696.1 DUF4382 domain-containing protein [Marinobacter salinexigens]